MFNFFTSCLIIGILLTQIANDFESNKAQKSQIANDFESNKQLLAEIKASNESMKEIINFIKNPILNEYQ